MKDDAQQEDAGSRAAPAPPRSRATIARDTLLSDTAAQLLLTDNPQGVVETLCRKVMAFLDCSVFFNFLADETTGKLHLNACGGIPAAEAKKIEWLDYGVAVCGCVARDGQAIVAGNIASSCDPRTALVRSYGVQAYCCHPLLARGRVLGTLSFGASARPQFSDDDISMMKSVATLVAMAMLRMQVEKALRESEARFRAVTANTPDHILMQDRDLRYERVVNPQLGLTEADMLGKTDQDFLDPEDARKLTEIKRRVIETGQPVSLEAPVRNANGEAGLFEGTYVPRFDAAGNVDGIIGYFRDIFERRQTEELLRFLGQCSVSGTGEGFFPELARYLAQALHMDFVCIDRLVEDRLTAQTLAVFHNGKFEDNVSYALKDTPCGDVVGKRICCFPRNVRALFAKDTVLQDLQAESYLGTTLWSSQGKPIGLIAVIGRQPLADTRHAESVLQVVAVRAAGELERLQAEEDLRASEERLRLALHAGVMATWDWHVPSGEVIWNDEHYRMLGYAVGEVKPSYRAWTDRIHPDDVAATEAILRRSMEQGAEYATEFRVLPPDGQERWIEARGRFERDAAGQTHRSYGVMLNITERKRVEETLRANEQRLRFHFENSPLAVVEWDASFVVTQWSRQAERIFGWKREETVGRRIDALHMIYEEDVPLVNRTMERLLGGRELTIVSSNRNRTRQGAVIECAWHNSVLLDSNGRMASVMSLVEDVTERKRAEKEIRGHVEELRAANAELARFNRAMVDRELRMVELKKEVNELLALAGQPKRYPLEFVKNP